MAKVSLLLDALYVGMTPKLVLIHLLQAVVLLGNLELCCILLCKGARYPAAVVVLSDLML